MYQENGFRDCEGSWEGSFKVEALKTWITYLGVINDQIFIKKLEKQIDFFFQVCNGLFWAIDISRYFLRCQLFAWSIKNLNENIDKTNF